MIWAIIVRSLLLACPCAFAVWLLRSRTAGLRFFIWKCLLLALFALPVLIQITPPLIQPSRVISHMEIAVMPAAPLTTTHQTVTAQPAVTKPFPWTLAVYLPVTLLLLARLGYSLLTLRKIAARTETIRDSAFRELSHGLWLNSIAFINPRLAESADINSPVTFDSGETWILLPSTWRLWSQSKLRAVLAHEMAHVQRDDAGTLFLASLATCLFWFNPLSWFLQRQLAALAEEACDEAVISRESSPVEYANFLIDFARDVRLAGAIAISGNSRLKRRIERLFAETEHLQQGRKLISVLVIILFVPALYLAAAARPDQPQEQLSPVWPVPDVLTLSTDDVAKLEADLRASPDNQDLRMRLLVYRGLHEDAEHFKSQLLWFIKEHPDVSTLSMAEGLVSKKLDLSSESVIQIETAWEQAILEHPDSAPILSNAAGFLRFTNPERALDLLWQATALSPAQSSSYQRAMSIIYAAAEAQALRPEAKLTNVQMTPLMAARLRTDMASWRDPGLLSHTGTILVTMSHAQAGDGEFDRGIELIQQAISLDPGNKQWQDALQNAREEPQRQANYRLLMPQAPLPQGTVRIGAKVAEASLISKTDPVYPPLCFQDRIQGVVKFSMTVGTDGTVQNLRLVSGHPLLVGAAKNAVLTYLYHPAIVDGKAVPFQTEVAVPFEMK